MLMAWHILWIGYQIPLYFVALVFLILVYIGMAFLFSLSLKTLRHLRSKKDNNTEEPQV